MNGGGVEEKEETTKSYSYFFGINVTFRGPMYHKK
jgi:hypothetical protein